MKQPRSRSSTSQGTLRIGDQWNAITIIAHSQTHPLKAICELTENAIDAGARTIRILRRRQQGKVFLEVHDDGRGVATDASGRPDFERIATHLCDSMKRHLDAADRRGVHGEFGIGLLSFWSLGQELRMISAGSSGTLHELHLIRGKKRYEVRPVRGRLAVEGTRVVVGPLLEATRKLVTGDKIGRYLAAELRDRIRSSGVKLQVSDRLARREIEVTPREFDGERLDVPRRLMTTLGDMQVELYIRPESGTRGGISLCKDGTRVLPDITELLPFQRPPWTDGRLEGIVDFEALSLAPGTRSGVVPDRAFAALVKAARQFEPEILTALEKREQAESDRASRQILKQVHKAFTTALSELPSEDYLFFDIPKPSPRTGETTEAAAGSLMLAEVHAPTERPDPPAADPPSLLAHDPGPLHTVRITPRSGRIPPGSECHLTAMARDAEGVCIRDDVHYTWTVIDGAGTIIDQADVPDDNPAARPAGRRGRCVVTSDAVGVVKVEVRAVQRDPSGLGGIPTAAVDAVTVKFMELADGEAALGGRGLPSYRLEAEHGQPWRSRYDPRRNEIVINSAHRDFLASRVTAAKHRRYIGKLYAKEVVLSNFPHESPAMAMERLIEVTLRTEDAL
jgi:hypothetical protein